MRRKTVHRLMLLFAVAVLLLFAALPLGAQAASVSNTGFSDVPKGAWYEDALLKMQNYTPGVISGVVDSDGVTRFHPDEPVTRAEFLKMAMTAAEGVSADMSRDAQHWAGRYYTIAMENNILIADAYTSSEPMFPFTREALEKNITRYEAAVILANTCVNMQMEPEVVVASPETAISDYEEMEQYTPDINTVYRGSYVHAAVQSYGKGFLYLNDSGAFHGEDGLTRSQAAAVIFRLQNWKGSRVIPDGSSVPEITVSKAVEPKQSFATWLQNGHLNGSTPDAEAREKLFGSSSKYAFYSSSDAAGHMVSVTVPAWAMDKTGNKYASQITLTVNKVVADEVRAIFEMIYNDPERFPFYGSGVGGARFTDTMRHSWGCAIDINPYYNCECNFKSGYQRVTCGYGWWPYGMDGQTWVGRSANSYHGTMSQASPYSIAPGSSVVRAFATYGWGWGGSGTNNPNAAPKGWSSGRSFDFMHFSVLPTGG